MLEETLPRGGLAPFVPIVPAGGAGTRLWPLSRRDRPKFLLDLTGTGSSLLQQTLSRLEPLADRRPIVVTGCAHERAVREQVGACARVVAEPSPRSSMPAIALAAALAERDDPDCTVGSFAADHVVRDPEAFRAAVRAARCAAEKGYLVTIGIEPTGPATCFGYIEQAESRDAGLAGTGALAVARFVEKPDRESAERFLAAGGFRWNAGMFVARASMLLDALAEQIPPLAAGARRIAAAHGTDRAEAVMADQWPALTTIAIDHALAEPLAAAGRVAVVPADFGWDDVGDFGSLSRLVRAAAEDPEPGRRGACGVLAPQGAETVGIDARATVYGAPDRLIALVGVQDVSVAVTEDAVLVISEERAQDAARIGEELARRGREDLR